MALTYKVLGQLSPAANTNTDIYTAPSSTSAVVSTISVCNRGASTTYRIAVRPANTAIEDKHYLVYNSTINQYDSVYLTLGITLGATDVITVYSLSNTVSFGVYGSEIS